MGWLLDRSARFTDRRRRQLVRTAGLGYLGVVVLLIWQALRAESLIHPGVLTLVSLAVPATTIAIAVAVTLSAPPPLRRPADVPRPRAEIGQTSDGRAPAPPGRTPVE